jgi:hypothetical protein
MVYALGLSVVLIVLLLIFIPFTHYVLRKLLSTTYYENHLKAIFVYISILSFPGIAGCAAGNIGVGAPLPLIIGLPMHLLLIHENDCGWLPFISLEGSSTFQSLVILSIIIYTLMLIFFYKRAKKKLTNRSTPDATR